MYNIKRNYVVLVKYATDLTCVLRYLIPFKLADKIYATEEQAFESESYVHELKGNNPILERENPMF